MFNDWISWLVSKSSVEMVLLLFPLLCLDAPRYTLSNVALCLWDFIRGWVVADDAQAAVPHSTPSVCVVLAGLNEAETIEATLRSVHGTYPNMEIVVVDDGSTDGMGDIAQEFAETHSGVIVLRKPRRGGKSSALNFALPYTKAEIVIGVDTDSTLGENAIWQLVQPFRDPKVGATGGSVIARNGHDNLVSFLQAGEYLRTIFLGRMLPSRLGLLNIVSGAFGAFRRDALMRTGGWDVGPGEDGDLVFRLRKMGCKIVHVPYAQCFTNVPTSWGVLFRQRRRWDWAIVTFDCRKHADMANFRSPNFRWSNFAVLAESWLFRILLSVLFVVYCGWLTLFANADLLYVIATNYVAYMLLDALQWIALLYYSPNRRRDMAFFPGFVLAPGYSFFLRVTTIVAVVEEAIWRRSWGNNYVPERVRRATWHW